jgi:hypothetical protein
MDFSIINVNYKPIPDFPDYYVTEAGDIYSTKLRNGDKERRLRKLAPKTSKRSDKYFNIILCKDGREYTKQIHRLVAENFVDGYFDGAVVNHIDGNNKNNNASNLEWTTIADNVHKSYATSGVPAKRNFKVWKLYDSSGNLVGTFYSHFELFDFIKTNNLNIAPEQLIKNCFSRGYYIIKEIPQSKTVTTIQTEYISGESPLVEAPASTLCG